MIMRNKLKGLVFLCMAVALPLTAQNVTVSGPDGKLQLTVSCPEGKEASYSLTYSGKQMLESSPLGLETNVGDFAKAMKLTSYDLYKAGFVEKIISEPESYTLDSMMNVFDNLEENISAFLENSKEMTEKERVEARYQRFRSM